MGLLTAIRQLSRRALTVVRPPAALPAADSNEALGVAETPSVADLAAVDEAADFREAALLAEANRNWREAELGWAQVREQTPEVAIAYEGEARALHAQGRENEAENVLVVALQRFPHETGAVRELARQAEQRRDWTTAERWWREHLAREATNWIPYMGLAATLREQGNLEEAQAVLHERLDAFPIQPDVLQQYAQIAEQRRDWPAALWGWTAVRERLPELLRPYLGEAAALRELRRHNEAEAILLVARERFPKETPILRDLAWLAERRSDWAAVEQLWRDHLALEPRHWFAHALFAKALYEQARFDEAEAVLLENQQAFPQDHWPFIDFARVAERRRDWAAALTRWAMVEERFPERVESCLGNALAQSELGRPDEAEAILLVARERFPKETPILRDLARMAERRSDWAAAEQFWREYLALEPRHWFVHAALAKALCEQLRFDETETLLLGNQQAFPQDHWPFTDFARVAERRRDWTAALVRWAVVEERFPNRVEGYLGNALALRELGQFDEATTILRTALQRFPKDIGHPARAGSGGRTAGGLGGGGTVLA